MSMKITNDHRGYVNDHTDARKKTENGAAAKVRSTRSTNGKDKVQDYHERLCKKFPQINFNIDGGTLPSSSSKVTVNLSYACLKKMADDPDFAKEIEWNLSGEVAANSMVYGCAKRDGVELGGRTVTYDANGNRQSSCGGMRTANAEKGNASTDRTQRYLKARKKRGEKEKIAKRRKEKKIEEERIAERIKERRSEKNAVREAPIDRSLGYAAAQDMFASPAVRFDVRI